MSLRLWSSKKLLLVVLFLFPGLASADWQYDYYEGTWDLLPDYSSLVPVASGTVITISTAPALQNDNFALRFQNQLTVGVAATYQFSTNSDDGSQLLIDGSVVVNNDGLHGATTVAASIFLNVGTYNIEVTHFEKGGGEIIEASYAPPGGGFRAIPADGVIAGPDQLNETGSWGPVIPWPHVPVSAANLPDGRVLTWASNERYSFPGGRPEFTFTAVWDPSDNSITEIDHPTHDMFCAHLVMLEDGQVFVSGGRNSGNSPWTSVFDIVTDSWVPLNNMNRGRWYPSSISLADGSVFTAIGSGGGNTSEVYNPDTGNWNLLSGIDFNPVILNYPSNQYGERNWWPLFHLMPDGKIFHSGPTPQMHILDTSGVGSAVAVGSEFTDWYPKHGSSVVYEAGMVLTAGGWVSGTNTSSTNQAYTIDLNGPSPTITLAQPMINARKFHNTVMLPNGEVLAVGGNTSGQKFNDSGSIYTVEYWNPTTGLWREGAAMSVPRNYHSIALLLTDGTVMSAGSGLCNCSADHPDAQIYSPDYLFNADGSLATRPSITSAPAAIRAGNVFDVVTDTDITQFSMIKMSSTTHAVNTDLRFLNISFSGTSGTYQLTAHSNPNVLTPGYYMLFALNAQGTPSVSKVVQVRAVNDSDPVPLGAFQFNFLSFADLSAFQLNGTATGLGGVARLTLNNPNEAGSIFYRTPASIGGTTSFETEFEFRISNSSTGAEGLAFVLQGNESTDVGQSGAGLGYQFVVNSLAVEIDTADSGPGDIDDNHISVNIGGDSENALSSTFVPFELADGNTHKIWVDYLSAIDTLEVYVVSDPAFPKPLTPILTVNNLSLTDTIGSLGYFGFSGSTGTVFNNHDIESWALTVNTGIIPLVVDPISSPPQSSGGPVIFNAFATGEIVQYSWVFGDGSPQTNFSSSPTISHGYASPGRYVVTLIVRDINGVEQTIQFVQAVYLPLTADKPSISSSIVLESSSGNERVWNVNPDNNTITAIDGQDGSKIAEISVGADPRSIGLAPDGMLWVSNKDDSTISIVDPVALSATDLVTLPTGSRPDGIVFDASTGFAFVALEQLGEVRKIDTATRLSAGSLAVGPNPRYLSITGDGLRLFASRFVSPPYPDEATADPKKLDGTDPVGGEVVVIDPVSMQLLQTITLAHSDRQPAEITGPGFPNYLGPAIVSPNGVTAWVPSKQDNILRGAGRNGLPINHDFTVRAVTSVFDVATATENIGNRVDHDNSSTARNGAFGPYGVYLFVALEGNRQVAVVDAFSYQEITRVDVGLAPQDIIVSGDGNRAYVHNFMGRSVTILDTADLMSGASESVSVLATVPTVASEMLAADILQGKRLFYDARDPRLALEMYMSCASCHNDGGQDGRVWDLTSLGEGLRNTISLKGRSGVGHGTLHWSANFDEVQDFENQIRDLAGGTGLMDDADFLSTQALLGAPKAGLSSDLDALAAYLASLNVQELSPHRNLDGSLTSDALLGKSIFDVSNCTTCHSGNNYTDSGGGTLHDIGTIKTASGQRMGGTLTGIDTPSLRGLWASAPYLHDGSAPTLQDAVAAHSTVSLGGTTFTTAQLDLLANYLLSIDDREVAYSGADTIAPSIPANVAATATGDTSISVTWDASTDDLSGVAGYLVFRDGLQIAGLAGVGLNDIGLDPNTSYVYTIVAYDAADPSNNSAQSNPASATTNPGGGGALDTTPPTIPTILSVVSPTEGLVELTWTTSTDSGSGVAGYLVYRDGGSIPIANIAAESYSDSSVNPVSSYFYQIAAIDNATPQNQSGRSLPGFVTTQGNTAPPSTPISKSGWTLAFVDSEANSTYSATKAFDGNSSSFWHTQWSPTSPPPPHEIQINLNGTYLIDGFVYTPRQDGDPNGSIAIYEFYVSNDGVSWGAPETVGAFANSPDAKEVRFTAVQGQYIRLRALSEINGAPWTSVAELDVLGIATGSTNTTPDGTIDSPASSVTILAGQSVDFQGTGTDADGDLPLTYTWDFGAGSGVAASFSEDPGLTQFNIPGIYTISLTVTDSLGLDDPSPATQTVTVTDPSGSAPIPKSGWTLAFVDSDAGGAYAATSAFDDNLSSMWHTQWSPTSPPPPHEIQINLNGSYLIDGFVYTPRQDGGTNGTIAGYEFYVSIDGSNWGAPVATGTFVSSPDAKEIRFAAVQGQYVRLRALTEVNANPWTSVAELGVLGSVP